MKKQNGFISSSSSVSVTYTTDFVRGANQETWGNLVKTNVKTSPLKPGKPWEIIKNEKEQKFNLNIEWKSTTYKSYHRIEYFLEAIEKINSPFESAFVNYEPLTNYSKVGAVKNLYNGFVDIVISFPFEVRLAGIELLNPWINKLSNSNDKVDWKFLPKKFSIFKVDNSKLNDALNEISYENDIARITTIESKKIRPIHFNKIENDENLIFLGKYEVNWENVSSYKCFFKYNKSDPVSLNINDMENSGTATWKFKQLILRIYETEINSGLNKDELNDSNIRKKVAEYIKNKEIGYGSTFLNREPNIDDCYGLIGKENISSNTNNINGWKFGSKTVRSYKKAIDVKFETGIKYKLGGIQLLLSPDIFSVSEMKMYNYANRKNNKVYIGEWNKDIKNIEYYGAGIIKRSPNIDISKGGTSVTWKHNFNIPPKYLEGEVYAKFNIDFGSFCVGDIVKNLVNINKEPLTIKLTGTDVQVNISKGICFTNPETGEFMTFMDGIGVQLDKPGNFDAYKIALKFNAPIEDYGSTSSAKIEGGFPFDLCFVVKRLF